jgi:hypothetical protein
MPEPRRDLMRTHYAETGRQVARVVNTLADIAGAVAGASAWGMLAAIIVGGLFGFGLDWGVAAFFLGFLGCFWQGLGRWLVMLIYSAFWGALWAAVLLLFGLPFTATWALATVAVVLAQWAKLAAQEPPPAPEPEPMPEMGGPAPTSPTGNLKNSGIID